MKVDTGDYDALIIVVFLAGVYLPIGFGLGFWFNWMFACSP